MGKKVKEMKEAKIRGDIINNDTKWIYDWLEWESTCPNDIKSVIDTLDPGEELRVLVNSGGGDVYAGQEIYTLLRKCKNSVAEIDSLAVVVLTCPPGKFWREVPQVWRLWGPPVY